MSRVTVNPTKAKNNDVLLDVAELMLFLEGWTMHIDVALKTSTDLGKDKKEFLIGCNDKQKLIAKMREKIVSTTTAGTHALGMINSIGQSLKQLGANVYEQDLQTLKAEIHDLITDLTILQAYLVDQIDIPPSRA